MPAPMTHSPAGYQLATRLADALTTLVSELVHESGPMPQGMENIAAGARLAFEPLDERYKEFQKSRNPLGEEEAAVIKQTLDDFSAKVEPVLRNAARDPAEAELPRKARRCTVVCVGICERLREAFGISLPRPRPRSETTQLAIVRTDLVDYTRRVECLKPAEDSIGPKLLLQTIERVDGIIRDQIHNALASLAPPLRSADHLLNSTGDGYVLRFASVKEAVTFARQLHKEAKDYSALVGVAEPYQHRVGIAFGWVAFRMTRNGPHEQMDRTGFPFIEAARMESCAPDGGIAIFKKAWDQLLTEPGAVGSELLLGFVEEKERPAKKDEVYHTHVWDPSSPAPPAGYNI